MYREYFYASEVGIGLSSWKEKVLALEKVVSLLPNEEPEKGNTFKAALVTAVAVFVARYDYYPAFERDNANAFVKKNRHIPWQSYVMEMAKGADSDHVRLLKQFFGQTMWDEIYARYNAAAGCIWKEDLFEFIELHHKDPNADAIIPWVEHCCDTLPSREIWLRNAG